MKKAVRNYLASDWMRSRALANTAMNYFVSQNEGNLSSWTTVSFLRKRHGQLFTDRSCSNSRRLVANPSSWPVRYLASPCEISSGHGVTGTEFSPSPAGNIPNIQPMIHIQSFIIDALSNGVSIRKSSVSSGFVNTSFY